MAMRSVPAHSMLRVAAVALAILSTGADDTKGCGPPPQSTAALPDPHSFGAMSGKCHIYLNDALILTDACSADVTPIRVALLNFKWVV